MKSIATLIAAAGFAFTVHSGAIAADDPANLNDLELAHVAYTADNVDIKYAHLALAISKNPVVHEFAKTMIRDHEAVNEQALALLDKLGATPQDNFLSMFIDTRGRDILDEMSKLRGDAFDKRYAENELAYHKEVNSLMTGSFIPNIENPEVKALFEAGLQIFLAHEHHAEMMVKSVNQ